jgi:endonuclease/exonuclease/phosphatase family metal-dependent hydrolase
MSQIRVMTYNIFMGGRKGPALDAVVRAAAPDVLLVNESPKWPFGWEFRCRRLATRWGMRFIGGGRTAGSNMIAATDRVTLSTVHAEVLPGPLCRPRRGIAAAQLGFQGGPLGVVSVHLSLDRARRLEEVERVIAVADGLGEPVVVAGDLNEPAGGPCWQRLGAAGFVDHGSNQWPTFPADAPTKRIDAVLVRGPARVVHHGDPGVPGPMLRAGSDHLPVLAQIEINRKL